MRKANIPSVVTTQSPVSLPAPYLPSTYHLLLGYSDLPACLALLTLPLLVPPPPPHRYSSPARSYPAAALVTLTRPLSGTVEVGVHSANRTLMRHRF